MMNDHHSEFDVTSFTRGRGGARPGAGRPRKSPTDMLTDLAATVRPIKPIPARARAMPQQVTIAIQGVERAIVDLQAHVRESLPLHHREEIARYIAAAQGSLQDVRAATAGLQGSVDAVGQAVDTANAAIADIHTGVTDIQAALAAMASADDVRHAEAMAAIRHLGGAVANVADSTATLASDVRRAASAAEGTQATVRASEVSIGHQMVRHIAGGEARLEAAVASAAERAVMAIQPGVALLQAEMARIVGTTPTDSLTQAAYDGARKGAHEGIAQGLPAAPPRPRQPPHPPGPLKLKPLTLRPMVPCTGP